MSTPEGPRLRSTGDPYTRPSSSGARTRGAGRGGGLTKSLLTGCLVLVACVMVVPALLLAVASESSSGLSPTKVLGVPAATVAALVLWRLVVHRFRLHDTVRILTNTAAVAVGFGLWAATESPDRTGTPALAGLALTFTAAVAVRALTQEAYLRGRTGVLVQAGTHSFDDGDLVRLTNPRLLRWAHRLLAVAWVWSYVLITASATADGDGQRNSWVMIVPAMICYLAGPRAVLLLVPLFPVTLVFLLSPLGAAWVSSNAIWLFIAVHRTPSDRRTNLTRAYRRSSRDRPWGFLS